MANNAGRQGGGGNGQMNEHVEFTVKVSFGAGSERFGHTPCTQNPCRI